MVAEGGEQNHGRGHDNMTVGGHAAPGGMNPGPFGMTVKETIKYSTPFPPPMTVLFLGRPLSGRFVIPSGILATRPAIIERIFRDIPEVGMVTTKSVGVEPEPGYREPVIAEDSPLNFVNAVGLRSPGMRVMRGELADLLSRLEPDGLLRGRFLMVSVFGRTEEEFATLVRHLSPVAHGIELNFSCPHSRPGYGATIGSHPETTRSFTGAAVRASLEAQDGTDGPRGSPRAGRARYPCPIFVKLTPNVPDIGITARAAMEGGATGITAVNTVGPVELREPESGRPVLTHVTGGRSGPWIRHDAARCVNRVREAVGAGVPVIGMGGISTVHDLRAFHGADLFGIGSALAGLDLDGIAAYFRALEAELTGESHTPPEGIWPGLGVRPVPGAPPPRHTPSAGDLLCRERLMKYRRFTIREVREPDHDLRILILDGALEFLPAQFVFLWLPGVGEKPFSPALRDPLTLAIRRRGIFTSELFRLGEGDTVYVRGPYGRGFLPGARGGMVILAGGTGSGVALRLAEEAEAAGKEVTVFQGCVNQRQVLFEREFRKFGRFIPGIDNGPPGEVLRVMERFLDRGSPSPENAVDGQFFVIGPEPLMKEGLRLASRHAADCDIFASVERETLCGVGLCGACELNGYRTCIRGTVVSLEALRTMREPGGLL